MLQPGTDTAPDWRVGAPAGKKRSRAWPSIAAIACEESGAAVNTRRPARGPPAQCPGLASSTMRPGSISTIAKGPVPWKGALPSPEGDGSTIERAGWARTASSGAYGCTSAICTVRASGARISLTTPGTPRSSRGAAAFTAGAFGCPDRSAAPGCPPRAAKSAACRRGTGRPREGETSRRAHLSTRTIARPAPVRRRCHRRSSAGACRRPGGRRAARVLRARTPDRGLGAEREGRRGDYQAPPVRARERRGRAPRTGARARHAACLSYTPESPPARSASESDAREHSESFTWPVTDESCRCSTEIEGTSNGTPVLGKVLLRVSMHPSEVRARMGKSE